MWNKAYLMKVAMEVFIEGVSDMFSGLTSLLCHVCSGD